MNAEYIEEYLAKPCRDKTDLVNGLIQTVKTNNADELTNLVCEAVTLGKDEKKFLSQAVLKNLDKIISNSFFSFVTIENLIKLGMPIEVILLKKEEIISKINGVAVSQFYKFCKDNNEPLNIDLNEYVELMLKEEELLFPENPSEKFEKDAKISVFLAKKLVSEFLEIQNMDLSEVEYLGAGGYSRVFRVGEFVIKLGSIRDTDKVPGNKNIIRPVLSFRIMESLKYSVEVQNLVDTKWWEIKDKNGNVEKELSKKEIEEELFLLYFKLRRCDIIWKDIKKENVGRLLKSNSSNLYIPQETKDGNKMIEEFKMSDKNLGIVTPEKDYDGVLPAGSLVITDRDYLEYKEIRTRRNPTDIIGRKFDKEYKQPNEFKEVLISYLGKEEYDNLYPDRKNMESFNK